MSSFFFVSTLIRGSPLWRKAVRCSSMYRNCRSRSACCLPVCSTLRWLRSPYFCSRSKRPIVVGQARWSNFFDNARNRERTHFSSEHGLPAVSRSTHCFKSAISVGSFFRCADDRPRQSDLVGRPIAQVVVELVAAPPDRFRMEASDRCDPLKAPMPQTLRLACCHPATLLLIQPAQQQIELPMIFPFRMFTRPASRTTALVNRLWCAHSPTPSLKCPTVYTKSSISRNRFWTGSYPPPCKIARMATFPAYCSA